MHDLKELRANPELFKAGLARRRSSCDIDAILLLDKQLRDIIAVMDQKRRERNELSKKVGQLKQAGQETEQIQAEVRALGEVLKTGEEEESRLQSQIRQLMLEIPILPGAITPIGADARENVEIRLWGKKPELDFEPVDHLTFAETLGILDFTRGGRITGSGFPVWVGMGARLERALLNFMLDLHTQEHGYKEMMTPFIANRDTLTASGQLPHLENDMYRIDKDDLFLIPTSETTLVSIHRDETLSSGQLPIKYTAYSPCFRREAGSWGKDTRGFQRTHQFNKVEMVRFEKPENSYKALEELVGHAEDVLRRLDLHYRVLQLCSGDLPFQGAACYDLEVWAPANGGRWLETSSCSNCEDFQARRANIRYRPAGGGKVEYVHTLNGSGLATSRVLVALLETCQTAEGAFAVPPVLRPYMGGITQISASK